MNNDSKEDLDNLRRKAHADSRRARNHSTMTTQHLKKDDMMNIKELSSSRSSTRSCALKKAPVPEITKFFEHQTNRDFNTTFNSAMMEHKSKRPVYRLTQEQSRNVALKKLLTNQYAKRNIDAFTFTRRRENETIRTTTVMSSPNYAQMSRVSRKTQGSEVPWAC